MTSVTHQADEDVGKAGLEVNVLAGQHQNANHISWKRWSSSKAVQDGRREEEGDIERKGKERKRKERKGIRVRKGKG
jgi:hypothetical protein